MNCKNPNVDGGTLTYNHGVTIAKAIAIILMVLGHSSTPDWLNNYLGLMRMPLFFMLSGYCFKDKYITDGAYYLKRRVSGVYVPYVKWGLFFLLMHNVFCSIGIYNTVFDHDVTDGSPYSLVEMLKRACGVIVALIANEELIGGYWFLHDLFWGSLIFYATVRFISNSKYVVLLLFALALAFSYFDFRLLYFVFPRTLLASLFIMVGYLYRKSNLHFEQSWLYIVVSAVVVFIVSLFFHTTFLTYTWYEMPVYASLAITGSLMIFGVGQHLDRIEGYGRDFLVYVGKRTFNVLTWHMLSFKLVSVFIIAVYGLEWLRIGEFTTIHEYAQQGWNIAYFIVGVGVPIAGSYCYDKIKQRIS